MRHESVSRHHAQIQHGPGGYQISDLSSRNFTYVNGRKLPAQTPCTLRHGDTIKICGYILEFRANESSSGSRMLASDHVVMVDTPSGQKTWSAEVDSSWKKLRTRTNANAQVHLRALMELTSRLQGVSDRDAAFDTVLDTLLSVFPDYDRAMAAMFEVHADAASVTAIRFRDDRSAHTWVSRTIMKQVMASQKAVLSERLNEDFAPSDSVVNANIGSLMCAPLIGRQGESFGVLQLESRQTRAANARADLELLATISLQVAQVLESLALCQLECEQREMRKQLAMARSIQFGLLPQQTAELSGYEIHDFYSPMQQVGGDYYTYITLDDGRLAIVVADVEGHGVPAALLVSNLASEVKLHFARQISPLDVLQSLNSSILHSAVEKFVTMVILVIEPESHLVTIVNAGHERPILRSASGAIRELGDEEAGTLLGLKDDLGARPCVHALEPGDLLVVYTDGVTDAFSEDQESFGKDRMLAELAASASAAEAERQVIQAVTTFMGEHPPADDMCMICIRRDSGPRSPDL